MPRYTRCTHPDCPEIHEGTGPCPTHRRAGDRARGTARQRGYDRAHELFRRRVLDRDPVCVLCHDAPSTVADHYPLSLRELRVRGKNPNDESNGRALCASCHGRVTALRERGGWSIEHPFDSTPGGVPPSAR